jgi:hypothetical protein
MKQMQFTLNYITPESITLPANRVIALIDNTQNDEEHNVQRSLTK